MVYAVFFCGKSTLKKKRKNKLFCSHYIDTDLISDPRSCLCKRLQDHWKKKLLVVK